MPIARQNTLAKRGEREAALSYFQIPAAGPGQRGTVHKSAASSDPDR
jgi:hypothetical protein